MIDDSHDQVSPGPTGEVPVQSGPLRPACVLLAIAVLAASTNGVAQGTRSGARSGWHRLSIVAEGGRIIGGPSNSLADQLTAAGYDGTNPLICILGTCREPTVHPITDRPGSVFSVSARYDLSRKIGLEVGRYLWNFPLGGAEGYLRGATSWTGFLQTNWGTYSTWAVVYWRPMPAIRLGAGPAWHDLDIPGPEISRTGVMLEAGLELRVGGSGLFLDLSARQHRIPTMEFGSAATNKPIPLRPDLTHIALTAGLGFRF